MNGFSREAEHILVTQIIICTGRSAKFSPEFGLCAHEDGITCQVNISIDL
jgi:hypothetical protein